MRFIHGLLGFWLVVVLPIAQPAHASTIPCVGDCAGDEQVTVDELVKGVNIALRAAEVTTCSAFDLAGDGSVTIDELV